MGGSARHWFLAGAFLIIVGTPAVVGWFEPDLAVSAAEKRLLNPPPAPPRSLADAETWPRRFEAYFNDHFGLRGPLAFAYSWLRYRIGDSPSDQVVRGRAGWFYLNGRMHGDPVGDYRGLNRFTPAELARFVRALRVKTDWLRARGADYLFVVAPNKHTIYPEFLPEYLAPLAPDTALDQLTAAVSAQGDLPFLDLRAALRAARASGRRAFHRTDSHWNAWGANFAQYALVRRLNAESAAGVRPRRWPASSYVWRRRGGGDLALLMGLQRVLGEMAPEAHFPSCATAVRTVSAHPVIRETACGAGGGTLLVFRDSFFEALRPYVSTYFDRAVFVDHRAEPELLKRLVARYRPDVVVEEWVERLLPMVPDVAGLDTASDRWGSPTARRGPGDGPGRAPR